MWPGRGTAKGAGDYGSGRNSVKVGAGRLGSERSPAGSQHGRPAEPAASRRESARPGVPAARGSSRGGKLRFGRDHERQPDPERAALPGA